MTLYILIFFGIVAILFALYTHKKTKDIDKTVGLIILTVLIITIASIFIYNIDLHNKKVNEEETIHNEHESEV